LTPKVSIILLSALRWNLTRRCLNSIQAHTNGVSYEIIIVDMGGSEDAKQGLMEYAARDSRLRLLMHTENHGPAKGRNLALAEAIGDFIVFLDNDTIVCPGWLDALLYAAETQPKYGLYGGKLVCPNDYIYFCSRNIVDEVRDHTRFVGIHVTVPYRRDDPAVCNEESVPWYPTGCLLGRKEDLHTIGGFDERFRFVEEDKDLCFRMRTAGKPVLYVPACEVIHDRGQDDVYDTTIRYNNIREIQENIRLFEKVWDCCIELVYSRTCLEKVGYSPAMIDSITDGPLREFFTVLS